MKKIVFILMVFLLIVFSSYDGNASSQSFKFIYKFTIKDAPGDAKEIEFWIPFPSEDKYQTIVRADIRVPGKYEIREDTKYGNKIISVFLIVPSPSLSAFNTASRFAPVRRPNHNIKPGFSSSTFRASREFW